MILNVTNGYELALSLVSSVIWPVATVLIVWLVLRSTLFAATALWVMNRIGMKG